jgi:hypothetical protein
VDLSHGIAIPALVYNRLPFILGRLPSLLHGTVLPAKDPIIFLYKRNSVVAAISRLIQRLTSCSTPIPNVRASSAQAAHTTISMASV